MRRKGFFLNSFVLLLLIPLVLLLATYEDVSSQILHAQSIRTQAERTYRTISYLDLDFQNTLEISGKRAIITVVDYVSYTGDFVDPNYMVNNTIRDLILTGNSSSLTGYNPQRIMGDQTIKRWLINLTQELNKQGFTIYPSVNDILNNIEIIVAPLDSFRVIIKAKIPNVTIRDVSGKIVYTGSIPEDGYLYSIVSLQNIEDPIFSALTGGRYYRSVKACDYSFPELLDRPFKVLEGNGSGTTQVVVGLLSRDVDTTEIYFGKTYPTDGSALAKGYVLENEPSTTLDNIIVNTTLNGVETSPADVFDEGDRGVLVFGNASGGGGTANWANTSLEYRLNITVRNDVGQNLADYQIPILLSTSKDLTVQVLNFLFSNTQTEGSDIYKIKAAIDIYDTSGTRIPFWIEYWDATNKKALIWIRDSLNAGQSKTYSIYFGSGVTTKGDGDSVFIFFDDWEDGTWNDKWVKVDQNPSVINGELVINGGNEVEVVKTKNQINYDGSFAVRFRMKAAKNRDWDSGIGIEDSSGLKLLFTDDYGTNGQGLAVHRPWWSFLTYTIGRSDVRTFHIYESIVVQGLIFSDAKFRDITDSWSNDDYYPRLFDLPLKYIYLVTDSERKARKTYYDFLFVRKYPDLNGISLEDSTNFSGIYITSPMKTENDIEQYTPPTPSGGYAASRAYDIQPFIECLSDNRYFGIYSGVSFFERLEGSTANHDAYEQLARQMQDEFGLKFGNSYYPIGLVSFMIPNTAYDEKLFNLVYSLNINLEENQTSFDYYFLKYYFANDATAQVQGYRVYGISYGVVSQEDLSNVYFFLDNQTAVAIFGTQGAQDLLKR